MKSQKPFSRFLLATSLLSCLWGNAIFAEKKIDPESAKIVTLLKAIFSKDGIMGEIKPSATPVPDLLDPTPLPRTLASGELDSALALFAKSFYLKEFMGNASIESDSFLLPNGTLAKISNDWTSVKTLSGKEVRGPRSKDSDMMSFGKIGLAGYSDKDPLSEARGQATVVVPINFARVDFGKKNLGQPTRSGDYEVVLDSLDQDVYTVRVKNIPGVDLEKISVAVVPMGAKGRLKTMETSDRSVPGPMPDFVTQAIADLESGKKNAKEVTKELEGHRKDFEKSGVRNERLYSARAVGTVTGLAVFIPLDLVERKIDTIASAEPKADEAKPELVRSTRYLNSVPPVFRKMNPSDLKKEIEIKSSRSAAYFSYNTPMVVCALPNAENGEYAAVEFIKPKLVGKNGAAVPFELENGGYRSEEHSSEIRFNPKSGKNPVVFEKAAGVVHLKYPLRITTMEVRKNQSGENLLARFNGPFVKVDATRMTRPESFFSKIKPVRAYDATGRELAPLSYSSTSSGSEGSFETFAFWGEPTRVSIDFVEEWAEFDLPFDLAPSKELPKPQGR